MPRTGQRKDPLLTAAVLKVSFAYTRADREAFKQIYMGVLRDFDISDEQVDGYIEANRERVERLARGEGDQGA